MIVLTDKQVDILERAVDEKERRHMDSLTIMNAIGTIADVLLKANIRKENHIVNTTYEAKILEKLREEK